jgi:hypothetical protein
MYINGLLVMNSLNPERYEAEYAITGSRNKKKIYNDPLVKPGDTNIERVKHCKTLSVVIDDRSPFM